MHVLDEVAQRGARQLVAVVLEEPFQHRLVTFVDLAQPAHGFVNQVAVVGHENARNPQRVVELIVTNESTRC